MTPKNQSFTDYESTRFWFAIIYFACGFVYSVLYMYGLNIGIDARDEAGDLSLYLLTLYTVVSMVWWGPFLIFSILMLCRLQALRLSVMIPAYVSYFFSTTLLPSRIFPPEENASAYLAISFFASILIGLVVYKWGLDQKEWPDKENST